MKCPYCDKEMETGTISLYEFGSVVLKMPATLKFVPDSKTIKTKKADQIFGEPEGYYCINCNRIIASYLAKEEIFK